MVFQRFQISSERTVDGAILLTNSPVLVTLLRCEELQFNLASHIVRPAGLGAILDAIKYADLYPKQKLAIACHTDTTDDASANQKLSERRAKSILSILTNDAQAFADLAMQNAYADGSSWEENQVRDIADILSPDALGMRPTADAPLPTSIKKSELPKAQAALIAACAASKKTSASTTTIADAWKWVHGVYVTHLLKESSFETMPKFAWADETNKAFGFGESYPIEKPGTDNFKSLKNRRADFIFFHENSEPAADKTKSTIEALYPASLDPASKTFQITEYGCRPPPPPRYRKVYILDRSASMTQYSSHYYKTSVPFDAKDRDFVKLSPSDEARGMTQKGLFSRLHLAQARLRREITELESSLWFTMISFENRGESRKFKDALVKADEVTKVNNVEMTRRMEALDWIDKQTASDGSTALEEALDKAFAMTGADEFYIITDGCPNQSDFKVTGRGLSRKFKFYRATGTQQREQQCTHPVSNDTPEWCDDCYQTYLLDKIKTLRREKGILLNVFGLTSNSADDKKVDAFLTKLAAVGGGQYKRIGT